jgi:RNA polymerase sigma-70 factor (ECF subfamily)
MPGEPLPDPDLAATDSVVQMAQLGLVLQEHQSRLLAMLRRRIDPRLQRRLSPEDVINDAFFVARRKWPEYQSQPEKLTPYAWLYRIVLDTLIEAWRKQNTAGRTADRELPWPDDPSVQLGLGLVNPATSPSEALAREDFRERMRQALAALKEQDREILWMRHHDQLSYQEAADVLGIKEAAASLRYVRALKRLKQLWEKLYPQGEP